MVRLKRAIKRSDNHRTELDTIRDELTTDVALVQSLQNAFLLFVPHSPNEVNRWADIEGLQTYNARNLSTSQREQPQ